MYLGIDLGGTKIEGVIIEDQRFDVVHRLRIPTEKEHGYHHIIQQIKKLISTLEKRSERTFSTIGIGTPGTIDPCTQLLKNSNTVCLNNMPFLKDLESALGKKVMIANDANCFALAEYQLGVVKDEIPEAKVVFGVIMGTGVGGGLIVNGKIVSGKHGIGGEWGHNYLDESGGPCYCGSIGCVEKVISGPALEAYYQRVAGSRKSLKDISLLAEQGKDLYATQTMKRLYTMFGRALSVITNIVDPDAIVLGGGVGNIPGLYTEGKYQLGKYIFNHTVETPILQPKLGDSAGVFGAALMCRE